jgi:single-strand DNA-binding protein
MFSKVIRLGKDTEVRFTQSGDPVASVVGVYNYGRKGQDGKRPGQWIDLSLWGKRAESLAQYLTKGKQVWVVIDDVHIETYQSQKGEGHKLVGKIVELELIGSYTEQDSKPTAKVQPKAKPEPDLDFDDSSIPF